MKPSCFTLIFIFCITLPFLINAEILGKRIYTATRIRQAVPAIDGKIDDAVWEDPEGWQGDFIQLTPNEGLATTKSSRFKITYDNDNLYAAIVCYDDPT